MERIIITFTQDGKLRGASVTDFDGLPQPLDVAALTALFPALNAAALAAKESAESELAEAKSKAEADLKAEQEDAVAKLSAEKSKVASLEAYKVAMVAKVSSALASNDLEQIQALAVEFLTPEQELKRAEKLKQLEALKAELGL